jgi:hypothetical protein
MIGFSTRRVGDALSHLGFFLSFGVSTEAQFVRANRKTQLFEIVSLHAGKFRGGRWGEFSSAGVYIALTPGKFTSPKGMAEYECLINSTPTTNPEEADRRARGSTTTRTKEQAIAWENFVVQAVPGKLEALEHARAEELLTRTESTRSAVRAYLAMLDRNLSFQQLTDNLTNGATEDELNEARRLARTDWLIALPERSWYDLISLLIVRKSGEVEGNPSIFWGKNPEEVPELKWRFQLLASRLYPEPGWELMDEVRISDGFNCDIINRETC